jgi:murein DD-endopeptidase MepM/ murein hydrolase activator NlpD
MADIRLNWEFDEGKILTAFDSVTRNLDLIEGQLQEVGKANEEAFAGADDELKNYNRSIDEGAKGLSSYKRTQADARKEGERYAKTLKDQAKEIRVFGVRLGDVTDGLKEKRKRLGESSKAAGGFFKSLGLVRGGLLALGGVLTGGILIAVGALISAFSRSQEVIDFFSVKLAQVQAVVDVFVDRLATLGTAIVRVFRGDFTGAGEAARKAIEPVGDELREEIRLAGELKQGLIEIQQAEIDLRIQRAAVNAQLKELNLLAEDRTKNEEDRIKALETSLAIERQLLAEEERIAKQKIFNALGFTSATQEAEATLRQILNDGISLDQLGLSLSTRQDAEEFAGLVENLSAIQTRSFELQTTQNNKLNTILEEAARKRQKALEEERARIQAVTESLNELIDTVEERVQGFTFENLTQAEQIEAEYAAALDEIQRFEQEARQLAERAGKALPESFGNNVQALRQQAARQREAALQELRQLDNNDVLAPLPTTIDQAAARSLGQQFGEEFNIAIENSTDETVNIFERLKEDLIIALGLNNEDFNFLTQNIGNAFSIVAENIQAATDEQIAQQDRIIDRLNQRINETQQALNRELDLKKEGYANDFAAQKENLEALQAEREAAEQKRLEFEKKAAQQRLIIDAAQQASALATGAAKVIAAESNKGLLGVAFAISAIASFFALFQKYKAAANQAAQPIELREGMIGIPGPSHEAQRSANREMRIQGTPYSIEGGESIINRKATAEHFEFLEMLNDNRFKGIDLNRLGKSLAGRTNWRGKVMQALRANDRKEELNITALIDSAQSAKEVRELKKEVRRLVKLQETKTYIVPDGPYREIVKGPMGERVARKK